MNDSLLLSEQRLAEGFADHAVAWAIEAGAPHISLALLKQLAKAVCLATSEGHVCIYLSDVCTPDAIAATRNSLLSSGIVGTPDDPATLPLILDKENRLYLHRYYDYEVRLARRLQAVQSEPLPQALALAPRLNALFGPLSQDARADWPRIAAALAMHRKLLVISGGPGTGKTTTIVNLLACLLEDNPDSRIALTAPTGKAAARMQEALRARASHLPIAIQSRLPNESFTIHRLLGVTSGNGEFRHHAGNPLPVDAVIVDEASMLDIALATKLFDAIPLSARIILLGDKDQLSAVEAGAVFSELSADPTLSPACLGTLAQAIGITKDRMTPPSPRKSGGLQDCVVWFTEQFRFASDSPIGRLAAHVSAGEPEAAIALLKQPGDASLIWQEEHGASPSTDALARIHDGYDTYRKTVQKNPENMAAIFDAFDRFRVLCAVKHGPRGVDALNRQIDRALRQALSESLHARRYLSERTTWYPGRPVIIQRNDYVLKLFNGDVGITLVDRSNDDERLMVYFPENSNDGENGFRAVAPSRLPEHETAFAVTVHKSQGSEFDSVLLMMPETPNRVTTRELLYTAITRARQHVTLCASETVLRHAITSPTQRNSGLSDRIREESLAS